MTEVETGGADMLSRVRVNDTTVLPGSERLQQVGTDALTAVFTALLNANDFVTMQVQRVGGTSGTGFADALMYVILLEGAAGEQGATGPSGGPQGATGVQGNTGVQGITGIQSFPQYISNAESLAQSTTTSSTFQQKVTISTGSIAAGTYRVGWSFEWGYSAGNNDFQARVQVDNTTTLLSHRTEPQDTGADQQHGVGGFGYVTLTAGTHTIDLDYASSDNSSTARIWNARLEIWRVV